MFSFAARALLGLTMAAWGTTAVATLGRQRGSVEEDRRALGGEPAVSSGASPSSAQPAAPRPALAGGVTVERFSLPGTEVREYLDPDGLVFAVAWEGLIHPDLDQLLGDHARAHREARASAIRSPDRRRGRVEAPGLVVETWGRMRHLRGRAVLTARLPPGVALDDIQ